MRIQYEDRTLFGSARITLAVERSGLNYEAGPPVNEALQISWSSVTRASSAGEKLVMAYRENGSPEKEVRIPLPVGIPGEALVAGVRSFVGPRWGSELARQPEVPVTAPRRHGRMGQAAFVWVLIGFTALCMFLALLAYGFILALLINEFMLCVYAFGGGAWLFRRGLLQYRNRLAVLGTPTAKANSAAIGLAELAGRARGRHVTPAPISATPSIYWKVEIKQWIKRGGGKGEWRTHLKRESPPLETVELEDETGRMPVWCHGAEKILHKQKWRSQRDTQIPAPAQALLASIRQKWPPASDGNHMELIETRLEEGGPMYVLGTLAELWRIQAAVPQRSPDRGSHSKPRFQVSRLGALSAIPIFVWGRFMGQISKELRRRRPSSPPDLDPHSVLVWKGQEGRPFIIADRSERETIESLFRRMWLWIFAGAGLMAGTLGYVLHSIFSE